MKYLSNVGYLTFFLITATFALEYDEVRAGAENGDMIAQYHLGVSYANGDGVEKDTSMAVVWFKKAAEQGLPEAQYNLGYIHLTGDGVEQDMNEAFKWYLKSAEAGLADSQFNISLMYKQGDGVGEDIEKAIEWAKRAAVQGHLNSQRNLGAWFGRGDENIEVDDDEAFKWYLMAAKQGYESATIIVGGRYLFGSGVDKDLVKAYAWLSASDSEQAKGYLEQAKKQMSEPQIDQAQAYVASCLRSNYQDCS